ncbi:MAG: 2-oxoacid:ferredoxin oxidoreductase subunit beta [Candidatus Portnoybacteria bacterium]|nr:2-oxoacid:ferredoxin oxidoreductase subunit beta [Candidatus Portnoybacteria bacterium]
MKEKNLNWLRWIKSGQPLHFCPGCQYGTTLRLLACALEKIGLEPAQVMAVSGIGCAGWITDRYLKTDTLHTTHGRPISFATGIKLARPELTVIVVSGDGDLATIGTNHLIHAARRNINLSVFCINNFLYGMTGGQAGATTPHNAITATTPQGNPEQPLDLIKLVLSLDCSLASRYPAMPIGKSPYPTIDAIAKTIRHEGFSFFEFISPCATHFGRKNKMPNPKELKEYLKNLLVRKDDVIRLAPELTPKERNDKLACGTFESLIEYLRFAEKGD